MKLIVPVKDFDTTLLAKRFGKIRLTHMKKTAGTVFFRILKLTSLCLYLIIPFSCTPTNSTVERRIINSPPPNWHANVSGTICSSDSTHKPLNGIKIVLDDKTGLTTFTYTDTLGQFSFGEDGIGGIIYPPSKWTMYVEDVDSLINGLYKDRDSTFIIPFDSTYDTSTCGSRWVYKGKKTVDMYLDLK